MLKPFLQALKKLSREMELFGGMAVAQPQTLMVMPVLLLLRPDVLLSEAEKEILRLAALATSERVAAFMTDHADLTLVRHLKL